MSFIPRLSRTLRRTFGTTTYRLSSTMTHAAINGTAEPKIQETKKLILCFDGTGNTFSGTNADTNVVKLLSKLDRNHADQFHYYQTGIGTYDINAKSVYRSPLGEIRSSISKTLDQGFGTTFDAHVMAGYRFLMRYYRNGAKIYIFGFSRGAYTARFLARMINKVGLLCKGNEEMVPFAFVLYQRYLQGEFREDAFSSTGSTDAKQTNGACQGKPVPASAAPATSWEQDDVNGASGELEPLMPRKDIPPAVTIEHSDETQAALNEIKAFSHTFCRKEPVESCSGKRDGNIKVYFLGIWDCVNSVAVLERKANHPVPVNGTAHYVRHAVAIDERRVKFKPALLAQDIEGSAHSHEDIKEVWFPGSHGDVGGGWPATRDNLLDENNSDQMSLWDRFKNFWVTRKPKEASKNALAEPLQMSDVSLAWMISELELVKAKDESAGVEWCTESADDFKTEFRKRQNEALTGFMHDTLRFGYGTAFIKVLFWKFMEYVPIIKRYELTNKEWKAVTFPPNRESYRDIPQDAVLHESVLSRLTAKPDLGYRPGNNNGDNSASCLTASALELITEEKMKDGMGREVVQEVVHQEFHKMYKFKSV